LLIPYLFPMFFYMFFLHSTNFNKTNKLIWSMFESVDLMIKCVFMASSYKCALNANTWPLLIPTLLIFLTFIFLITRLCTLLILLGNTSKVQTYLKLLSYFHMLQMDCLFSFFIKLKLKDVFLKRGGPKLFKFIFH